MTTVAEPGPSLDDQIAAWRRYLGSHRAISIEDADELESHLRDQVGELAAAGLNPDEAFLIAVRRLGTVDQLSWEFAREHSERLWKQLVAVDEPSGDRRLPVALALGAAAGLAVKAPDLLGWLGEDGAGFYARNTGLLVLPFLAAYFCWRRSLHPALIAVLAAVAAVAAVLVNLYPFSPGPDDGATLTLTAVHLPIALWLLVGVAYTGGQVLASGARMDFLRFTGEWFIYYVLIALGGMVLVGTTQGVFSLLGAADTAQSVLINWVAPCGAAGAVLVAAWLVEAKQSVVENMAPVLTKVFTPLFTLMLVVFLAVAAWQPAVLDVDRDVLIIFDVVLIIVLALLLYSVSARDPASPAGMFDRLQLIMVVSALIVNAYVLVAMAGRIGAFGFSPNKVASLGLNLILLVALAGAAWLLAGFLRGRRPYLHLERWLTWLLPVSLAWALVVALGFPPVFGFV